MTDGGLYGDAEIRKSESIAAAQVLGYGPPEFWAIPDREVRCDSAVVQRLVTKIQSEHIDLVYAPSPWEIHPDHRQTHLLALEAARRCGPEVRLAFYEVGSPLRPNVMVDLTPWMEVKTAAMECFGSQQTQQDYLQQILALNRYRSYTLGPSVAAAEAFWVITAQAFDATYRDQLHALVSPGTATAKAMISPCTPLVSVLLTSRGGPFLHEALDSVALQTYADIEVCVINRSNAQLALPDRCGRFPLSVTDLDASSPAQLGGAEHLSVTSGDYLLFLDEDDFIYPDHVSRLVQSLLRQDTALAAYTSVAVVGPTGIPTGSTIDCSFNVPSALDRGGWPNHAALVHKDCLEKLVAKGPASEVMLPEVFWPSIAATTYFIPVAGASAAFRQLDGRPDVIKPRTVGSKPSVLSSKRSPFLALQRWIGR